MGGELHLRWVDQSEVDESHSGPRDGDADEEGLPAFSLEWLGEAGVSAGELELDVDVRGLELGKSAGAEGLIDGVGNVGNPAGAADFHDLTTGVDGISLCSKARAFPCGMADDLGDIDQPSDFPQADDGGKEDGYGDYGHFHGGDAAAGLQVSSGQHGVHTVGDRFVEC